MASQGDTVVTTQPRSKRHELEKFVRDLDPTEVVGRSAKQCKYSDSLELLPSDHSCMYIYILDIILILFHIGAIKDYYLDF